MVLSLYPDWNKMRMLVGHGDAWQDLWPFGEDLGLKGFPVNLPFSGFLLFGSFRKLGDPNIVP